MFTTNLNKKIFFLFQCKHVNLPTSQHVLISIERELFMRFKMLVITSVTSEMFLPFANEINRQCRARNEDSLGIIFVPN